MKGVRLLHNMLVVIFGHLILHFKSDANCETVLNYLSASMVEYTQEDLENAIVAHFEHGLSVRDAASLYGVPKSTLSDKLKIDQPLKLKRGRRSYLTFDEEKILVNWATDLLNRGFPRTISDLQGEVQCIINADGR